MIGDILQPTHLLFILVVALIVLGPKRLPEVGKSLGKGLRDFRVALSSNEEAEQLREGFHEARANLQDTHETLHQPIVMQPEGQQSPQATVAPEATPANGEIQHSAETQAPPAPADPIPPAEGPTSVQEPADPVAPAEEPADPTAPAVEHEPAQRPS